MIYLYVHCPFTEEIIKIVTIEGFVDDQHLRRLGVKMAWSPNLEDVPYLSLRGMTTAKDPINLHLKLDPTRSESCKGCTQNKLKCKTLPPSEGV